MKISVITPSYNQAQFLPHNLRTVSAQTGVELEHIIVDPGSTDGSTELARAAKHAILLNEPDRGQSHGITKGFAMSTGDVITWLNSDDMYPSPDTLAKVAAAFKKYPDADIVYGGVDFVDEDNKFLRKGFVNKDSANLLNSFHYQVGIVQPGVFTKRKVFEDIGGPSEDYNYCMDYEYWVRMADHGFKWQFINETLAHHRWWSGMKTSSGRGDSLVEHFKVCAKYFGYIHHKWLDRYGEFLATNSDGVVNHASAVDPDVKNACIANAIEKYVSQDMLINLAGATDTQRRETAEYIARHAPGKRRVLFGEQDFPEAVSTHADPEADKRVAWRIFDTVAEGRRFKTYKVPNNFVRHFDSDWYHTQQARSADRMRDLSERRKDICIIVGNGPSLNKSNLDLLPNADVIVSNFAVISKKLRKAATYLTIVNDLVASQGSVDFNRLPITKIVPFWLGNSINEGNSTVFLRATVEPVFCTSLDGIFSWRSTVSFFNMQVAFALGYQKVILIGFDHSYQQAAELKEGASIKQVEEDPNHFDPRYFQGKTWQAADTANMEKMYLVARDVFKEHNREIVNATVGGKLEVFPRVDLEEALGLKRATTFAQPMPKAEVPASYPKLLILDMTAMGNGTATGEIKSTLFKEWPKDRILQVASKGKDSLILVKPTVDGGWTVDAATVEQTRAAVEEFQPDAILYRPVPDVPWLHNFAMSMIKSRQKPVVTWIMDDWPSRLEAANTNESRALLSDLKALLAESTARLSICEAMSDAFKVRYGVDFTPIANGIDPKDWPAPRVHQGGALLVRYSGGLAKDMTLSSVMRVAKAVERLAEKGMPISFEINTQKWWLEKSGALFAGLKHTRIGSETLSTPDYREWLSKADVVVIAYNFDPATLTYVRYSMANKMPECLASGAALLAIGPKDIATIGYLDGTGAAMVVDKDADAEVEQALRQLYETPTLRTDLSARGHALAQSRHNLVRLRAELHGIIQAAVWGRAAFADPGVAAASQAAPLAELEQLRANFKALSDFSADLEKRLAGSRPIQVQPGQDILERLLGATDADSARLILTTVGSGLLLDRGAMTARLDGDPRLREALTRALATLPEGDRHRQQFLRVQERQASVARA